jgi:hypothetical protein
VPAAGEEPRNHEAASSEMDDVMAAVALSVKRDAETRDRQPVASTVPDPDAGLDSDGYEVWDQRFLGSGIQGTLQTDDVINSLPS